MKIRVSFYVYKERTDKLSSNLTDVNYGIKEF
jgi:hypothetical protein